VLDFIIGVLSKKKLIVLIKFIRHFVVVLVLVLVLDAFDAPSISRMSTTTSTI